MISKYVIYEFRLQRNIDGMEEIISSEKCADMIEGMFPKVGEINGLNLVGTQGKGKNQELSPHGNKMESNHRQIATLLIEANKTKKITTKYQERSEVDNPFLRVMFDLRPEHCYMAVERKASAMPVENAAQLIEHAFNYMLWESGWKFKYEQPKIPMEFWDILVFIRKRFNDRLKKVSLVFDDTMAKNKTARESESDNDKKRKVIDDFISHFSKGNFSIDMGDDERMEKYKNDILHLATLCAEQNYQLIAEFRMFGPIGYTKAFPALMAIEKKSIDDFTGRREETAMGCYALESWFDNIYKLFGQQKGMNDDERRRDEMDMV